MVNKFKIDIISDVVCPWCIIGYANLKQAIDELDIADKVDIEWQPFELNPDMPAEGEELRAHSARKYGSTPESSRQFRTEMTERGKEVGFEFSFFEGMKIVNTRESHIMLEYAKDYGKQTELKQRLFSAFFTEKKDISDRAVLLNEVAAVSLDIDKATKLLESEQSFAGIEQQEAQWHQLGVSSVPTVVFNRTSALSGAHPVESFKKALINELNLMN